MRIVNTRKANQTFEARGIPLRVRPNGGWYYNLPRPLGIYWTPSPIFLYAEACERFAIPDTVAPTIRENPANLNTGL
jgi:hypothetical protein